MKCINNCITAVTLANTAEGLVAGKRYGKGSSREHSPLAELSAGVRLVIAESFERIHRSNLVGMGVLPLQFLPGETRNSHGLTGREVFDIAVGDDVKPLQEIKVTARHPDTGVITLISAVVRIDTPVEVEYYRNGGILHTVLRKMAES